jgi:DNA-binding CsgD family transcriptional regulator
MVKESKTTDQIADELVLSPETVRSHIKNILRKLKVRSRQEAVAIADEMRKGAATIEGPASEEPLIGRNR